MEQIGINKMNLTYQNTLSREFKREEKLLKKSIKKKKIYPKANFPEPCSVNEDREEFYLLLLHHNIMSK